MWDYVFDVELDSGAKLKLAMDAHENPYIVADRFLAEYELPAEFKEQVRLGGAPGPRHRVALCPPAHGFPARGAARVRACA